VPAVRSALQESGLAASRLELEITETVLLQNTSTVLGPLHTLRDLGVRVSLDDFGTGYSSTGCLRVFPFDRIKIDQSFVRELGGGMNAVAVVHAIIDVGCALGMSITAEGVATVEQMNMLRAESCSEVQGNLFSPPVPASDVPSVIERFPHGGRRHLTEVDITRARAR
jgi:EAL domain-containing protein (putative c-di-GMP-specific phosphodiesterase class I)